MESLYNMKHAYKVQEETEIILEKKCNDVYMHLINVIQDSIEWHKSNGYFCLSKSLVIHDNPVVTDKVVKMLTKHIEGYGYNVYIMYPDNRSQPTIEISWKKSFLFLFWKKIKRIISIICPK